MNDFKGLLWACGQILFENDGLQSTNKVQGSYHYVQQSFIKALMKCKGYHYVIESFIRLSHTFVSGFPPAGETLN